MPHWLYDSETAPQLSHSARALLEFFYRVLNRTSTPCFSVSEKVIAAETGLSPKTIRAARIELERFQLLRSIKTASRGAPYVFYLLNPETKEPFAFDGKAPAVYDPDKRRRRLSAALDAQQKVSPCAVVAPSAPAAALRESQPTRTKQELQRAATTSLKLESTSEPSCPIHGSWNIFFPPEGGVRCGICETNPYEPQPSSAPLNDLTPLTAAELFKD